MWDFWGRLFDASGFPARWQCGSWTAGHGWLHVLSDVGIWAAYFVIPCVLGYYAVRRRGMPFRGVLLLFVAFILLCGLTHLMEAAIFWWPAYRLAGVLKLLTAVVSWATVLALFRVTPRVMAFRSPAELEAEIAERHRAEGDLRALQAELEERVGRRTAELEGAAAALRAENEERERAEAELRGLNARLEERVADSLRQRLDERRRAEEALFGTRTQLLDAIESLDAGFVMYGPDERMVVCNAKYKEIYAECAHTMVPGTPYEEVLRAFVGAGAVSHTGLSDEEWVGRRLHAHRHPGEPAEQWLAGRWIRISDRLTSNGGVVSLRTDITALKHARQAAEERALELAKSEQTLRHQTDILTSILDSMGDAVIAADRDGKLLVFNPAAKRMHGAVSMDASPDQWHDLYRIYLADGETLAPASELPLARAMRGEESNDVEMVLRFLHRPERVLVSVSGRPLRGGGDGGESGGIVVIRDITARKRAEASLRESEERFRSAFDSAPIGMALVALEGRWLQVNRSLCELTGYTERELLATDFQTLTHPDDLDADLGHVRRLLDGTARTYQLEKRYFHKRGHVVHVLLSASLVRDGRGQPLYFVAQIKDVTQQKADEKALAANEELLRQFIKHSPAAIAMFDRDMSYIQASDRWLTDYHLAGRDVIGSSHYEVFTGIPERWRAGHRRVLAGGVERCEEDRIERADGSAEWLQWECRPWRDAEGEVGGVIMFTQVITQRKVIEEQVRASLREKEVLLKEIHHRVKNNLQVVSTLLDLQSGHTTDPAAVEMFKESRGRVRSMALIHERLYRSQDMARVDLAEYVRQLAADLHRTYRMSEGIRLELAVDVPPLAIDIAIPCGLLLNELISNCFKHAFADAAEGCLRVALRRDDGVNVLTVADDGAGFPAGTDFRNTASFGLQLVNTMVDQLGGEIALTSDRGTTVTVRFPKQSISPTGTLP